MSESKADRPLGYGLRKVTVNSFTLPNDYFDIEDTIIEGDTSFKLSNDLRLLVCALSFDIYQSKNHKNKLIIEVESNYEILNAEQYKINANTVRLPKNFLFLLANSTYDITRGIILGKLKETAMKDFLLPEIDQTSVIPEELVLEPEAIKG